MFTRLNDAVGKLLMVCAAVLAFLLCFLVVADVVGRVFFNSPVKGTPEIVSFSIVVICFLQAGFAIRSGGMLHVDTFVNKLPAGVQSWLGAVGALIGMLFFAFICYGSIEGAMHAWSSNEFEGEGALRVPVWPARFVIVMGTALAASSYLILTLENIALALKGQAPQASTAQH